MKTTEVNPLVPLDETSEEALTRLSADLGTLTGLMNDAERVGHYSLAMMFNRARDSKAAQAEGIIAPVSADSEEWVVDRRFLLLGAAVSAGIVPIPPRQKFHRSPIQLALTV